MMPPKPRAEWSVDPRSLNMGTDIDSGEFKMMIPLFDGGRKKITVELSVTADRKVRLKLNGEADAEIVGFEAWSNI